MESTITNRQERAVGENWANWNMGEIRLSPISSGKITIILENEGKKIWEKFERYSLQSGPGTKNQCQKKLFKNYKKMKTREIIFPWFPQMNSYRPTFLRGETSADSYISYFSTTKLIAFSPRLAGRKGLEWEGFGRDHWSVSIKFRINRRVGRVRWGPV